MKKYLFLILIIIAPQVSLASVPAFPMSFWGSVTVDGVPASAGAEVRAYSGSTQVGSVAVSEAGTYGYDDPTKQKLLVSEVEGVITFTIESANSNDGVETGGLNVVSYPKFVSGETVNKDLAFVTIEDVPEEDTAVDSGGSSSGGGRGGGSSSRRSSINDEVEPAVLGIATSTDEAQVRIEMQKQIIALLTQLILLLQLQIASQSSL